MGKNSIFVYIVLGLLVLAFLFFVVFPALTGGDKSYDDFSSSKGSSSNGSATDTGTFDTSIDRTPRIMYWTGKINQHTDKYGTWTSDPDNSSKVTIDTLTYCKKWYPKTISTRPYKQESSDTWISGSGGIKWSASKWSIECVQAQ